MRPGKPAPNRQTLDAQGLSLAARMGYLQVMRAGLATVVLASAGFAAHLVGATFRSLAVATGAYALIAASGEAIRRRVRRRGLWIIGGLLLVDGLYLAWVMFLTGGTQSPLRFLVYVQLIAVTLLASYRTGLKVALWHTLLLFVVLYAQAAGLLQPVDATEPSVGGETFGESVVFNVMAFWLVALGTAAFSAVNERELRRRKADLEALAGMATGLDNASDPAGIARILLESLGEAFGFKRGVVLGASHGDLRLLAQMGLSEPAEERTGPDSVVKQAWDKRRPVLVKQLDPGRDPQLHSLLGAARYVVVVPLIADGYPLGVLAVENAGRIRSVIERRVLSMLGQFGSHAALALRNSWLLEEVQKMAETDPLTGVANRRTFEKVLERELSRAVRGGTQVSLVMIDIDHFKGFNDAFGHQAGDEVLRRVGRALEETSRNFHTVARYGGEEFAVIVPLCSWEQSLGVAERLRKAASRVKAPASITASAGVATFPVQATDAVGLIAAADEALYESKARGRDRLSRSPRHEALRDAPGRPAGPAFERAEDQVAPEPIQPAPPTPVSSEQIEAPAAPDFRPEPVGIGETNGATEPGPAAPEEALPAKENTAAPTRSERIPAKAETESQERDRPADRSALRPAAPSDAFSFGHRSGRGPGKERRRVGIGVLGRVLGRWSSRRDHETVRQRTLGGAASALSRSGSKHEVSQMTVDMARGMFGEAPASWVTLLTGSPNHMVVAAASGTGAPPVGSELNLRAVGEKTRGRLAAGATLVLAGAEASRLEEALGATKTGGRLIAVPVTVGGRLDGSIVIKAEEREGSIEALEQLAALAGEALERVSAGEAHRGSEEWFSSLVRDSSDVILVVAPDTTIRYVTSSVRRVLGFRPTHLLGSTLLDLLHPEDTPMAQAFFDEATNQLGESAANEWRVANGTGSWRSCEVVTHNLMHDPNVGGLVVTLRDVSERKALEAELAHMALYDPLTSLPNRALFMDRIQEALSRQEEDSRDVAVVLVSLDDFKTVNDSLGHAAGDRLLVETASRLEGSLSNGDTLARLSGDEFGILLSSIETKEDAARFADDLAESLRAPHEVADREVFLHPSMGVALGTGGETAEEILRNASVAMHAAKSYRRTDVEFFEPSMRDLMLGRLHMRGDLRRAVDEDELVLRYQPIVELGTGEVMGVEALVRWKHPKRGMLAPAEFVPLAEESGLIAAVDTWVLQRACRDAQAWRGEGETRPFMVSANVSARQLQRPDLVDEVSQTLEGAGLDPQSLVLEITEGLMMRDTRATMARLEELKSIGVRVAIDDFGTGYSSLSYLKHFPVDILKIDKLFVDGLGRGKEESAVAGAIIDLSHTLGLLTIAEGIETDEQVSELQRLGCHLGQGHFFSRPLAARGVEGLMEAGGRTRRRARRGKRVVVPHARSSA